MANSDNSSPPPVEPVDQLAELRRKRGVKPERAPAPRSGCPPTTNTDRNRFDGANALNGAGPLGVGLGPNFGLDDVDGALDAIPAEPEPARTRTSAPERPEPPPETDVDAQLDAAVAGATDEIRDGLRHHHERRRTRHPASVIPHGSADLQPQPKRTPVLFRARDQAAAAKRELDAAFGHMLRSVSSQPAGE